MVESSSHDRRHDAFHGDVVEARSKEIPIDDAEDDIFGFEHLWKVRHAIEEFKEWYLEEIIEEILEEEETGFDFKFIDVLSSTPQDRI